MNPSVMYGIYIYRKKIRMFREACIDEIKTTSFLRGCAFNISVKVNIAKM